MKHDWRSRSVSFSASPSIRKTHSLFLFTLPLCIIGSLTSILTSINTVTAQQVTSDGTVSTTVITPDGKNFNINDGTTRGGNLFHSFKEFSIPTGGSATFNNAANIQNIISRVTGGSISTIDGLIKANGAANLFLLNPAGIIFGPNASLNIGGSFLGSTANSFLFDNGFEFSATNPQAPPLLTINIPIGLRFRDNPQSITNQSRAVDTSGNFIVGFQVSQGNSIALVGGNVSLDGGTLIAPGGRIELGGLSTAGTVGLNGDGSLSFPVGVQRGDVSLTNEAEVNVSAGGGGSIAVNARNLDILGGSRLLAGIEQGLGTVGSQAGDITLNATGNIKIVGSYVFNNVRSQATGNSGNINIRTGSLSLTNGAQLSASTSGQGNAGNVSLQASDLVSLAGNNTGIFSTVQPTAVGNGGNININAPIVSLNDGAEITASSSGNGAAGDIEVLARSIRLDDNSIINADSVAGQGKINLGASDFLLLRRGSKITTNATGTAGGGNITINTGNLVAFPQENSDITANAEEGYGGQISINIKGGIFGIEPRPQETQFSDITASSYRESDSLLSRLKVTYSTDVVRLPEVLFDPAQEIAQHPCIKGFGSTFTITGRGGLPTDPNKILSGDNVRVDLIKPVASTVSSTSTTQKQPSQQPTVKKIIPAQGWIFNEKGEVLLVGYDPTKTGVQRKQPAPASSCAAVR